MEWSTVIFSWVSKDKHTNTRVCLGQGRFLTCKMGTIPTSRGRRERQSMGKRRSTPGPSAEQKNAQLSLQCGPSPLKFHHPNQLRARVPTLSTLEPTQETGSEE